MSLNLARPLEAKLGGHNTCSGFGVLPAKRRRAMPTIIGRPAILVVDDNRDWIEQLEFSLGDKYRIAAAPDLTTAAQMAPRHGPEVMLLDWEIAKREVKQARAGITTDEGAQVPA